MLCIQSLPRISIINFRNNACPTSSYFSNRICLNSGIFSPSNMMLISRQFGLMGNENIWAWLLQTTEPVDIFSIIFWQNLPGNNDCFYFWEPCNFPSLSTLKPFVHLPIRIKRICCDEFVHHPTRYQACSATQFALCFVSRFIPNDTQQPIVEFLWWESHSRLPILFLKNSHSD